MKQTPTLRLPLAGLVAALSIFITACAAQPAMPADAEATISALTAANAALATQVADLSAAAGTPIALPVPADAPASDAATSAAPEAALVAAPEAAPAVIAPAEPGSALPRLVASVPLAPEGATIADFRYDRTRDRLYVTDTAGQLHILDATSYAPVTTLPFGGNLELDERNGRLYVFQPFVREGEEPAIHVLDTATLAEVGVLSGGAIAVDTERNRLFVGEPYTYSTTDDAPGVRIVDGTTLPEIRVIDQPGAPVYNPERNELLIVAYTVYTADPETGEVTGDLYPELTDLDQIGFLWCNSCRWADGAWYVPGQGMIAIDINAHCAGKGCGVVTPPRWYNAATMEAVDATAAPELQADCGSAVSAAGLVGDRYYRNRMYDRYVVYTNLYVDDLAGQPITWRDGLSTEFVNANTGQGYLFDGRVIDLATLSPIGQWPAACVLGYDAERGLLFGKREGSLYVIAERGGPVPQVDPPADQPLPDTWITGVHASPAFAVDNTILAESENGAIYRSTDAGASWVRLRGGLPEDEYQTLTVAFSPNYGVDRTLYATGFRGEYWGQGVWRSTDGGDSWQPLWNDLTHLRGEALYFDADFAQSQTLVVQSEFYDVAQQVSGKSYHQSIDGGLTWTLVVTGGYSTPDGTVPLPPVSELLPNGSATPALAVRLGDYRENVLYTVDGSTWQTATVRPAGTDLLHDVLPAPGYPASATAYAISGSSIWRTTDDGATWAQWDDDRFAAPDDFDNKIRSAAITPLLASGGYRLLLGTGTGEVVILDPTTMAWQDVPSAAIAADAPAPAAAVDISLPTPTPLAPEPLSGDPPADLFRPEGGFASFWENSPRIQQDLGWAMQAQPVQGGAAIQRFDNGVMVWVQENGRIYAFLNDGTWRSYEDTFREGDPERDPAFGPPPGKQQPERGFGKVWRENPDLRDAIGWALAKEEPSSAQRQLFERGTMLRVGVFAYTMVGTEESGTWY